MTNLALHILLFVVAGTLIALVPLLIGRFVRPTAPTEEKDSIYECGEPTIGSSYIQFDIRFYVVALLFIIFDVEVAFFFPWAVVYGGAIHLSDTYLSDAARVNLTDKLLDLPAGTTTPETAITALDGLRLAFIGFADILVFFGVLLLGFAYVWRRGDLDWVRSMVQQTREAKARQRLSGSPAAVREPVSV